MRHGQLAPPRGGQLALPLEHVPQWGAADFLEAPSNATAMAWLDRTRDWPDRRLALSGEAGVGKTHLLHVWTASNAARLLTSADLASETSACLPPDRPLAIDRADQAAPETLLHVLNAAAEGGHPVLLAARLPPGQWPGALPDLASRLRAMLAVAIEPPEESLLRALLARLLAERQLAVPETVQEWMLTRLARTPAALREAALRFDRASLAAGSSPPRAIAARVVESMGSTCEDGSDDEDFTPSPGAVSRAPSALL